MSDEGFTGGSLIYGGTHITLTISESDIIGNLIAFSAPNIVKIMVPGMRALTLKSQDLGSRQ